MKVTKQPIEKLSAYIEYIANELLDEEWIFRGHEDSRFSLKPSVARIEPYEGTIPSNEEKMLSEFKKRYLSSPTNPWDLLALTQHHGLPTRLLDWTKNPLVAMFFAVERPSEYKTSTVWAYRYTDVATQDLNPFEINNIHVLHPSHVTQRITSQHGCFTAHPPPFYDMRRMQRTNEELISFSIKKKHRAQMRIELDRIGLNYAALFPDLDGLCKYLKWSFSVLDDE